MPFCTRCGHANPEGSRFCSNCGNPLAGTAERLTEKTSTLFGGLDVGELGEQVEQLPGEAVAAVEALPSGAALLVVRRGPNAGSRFLLDAAVTTAGRHPESDIFLDDVTVSRRHAEFRNEARGFVVADVGSLNGTYVNRERIDEVVLADGDEVQVGKYRFVFYAGRGRT
jgi:pSer/pThr/pTyr-binding forkhead associated (FHA) protein